MANRNLNAKINVTFSEATSRQSLDTGDAVPTLFGKIKRWLSDLKAVAFSGSYADLTGKPTSLPASDVYSWAKAANKPSYTAGEVGALPSGSNAVSASKLATARTISLTGDVTGSTSFDGSGNASITATVADDSHNHVVSNVDGLQAALDGKAATSHTHNYAGSSSAGGVATNAARLSNTSAIGSATKPVYFNANGVPVAGTYNLEKSVPSNAVFTDTTYSAATTSAQGLMTAADKTKLNGIAAGAQVNPTSLKNPYALTLNGQTYDGSAAKNFGSFSKPNLIDNPDFVINQRGQSSYTGHDYSVDRFMCRNANTTLTVHDGYVTFSNSVSDGKNHYLWQPFEKTIPAGTKVTLSVMYKNVSGAVSLSDGYSYFPTGTSEWAVKTLTWTTTEEETAVIPAFISSAAPVGSIDLKWAKLEYGETATQFIPPNPATELAKCQRYYYQSWDDAISTAGMITKTALNAKRLSSVDLPQAMRITPTIKLFSTAGTEGKVQDWTSDAEVAVANAVYTNSKSFVPASSDLFTASQAYYFHYSASADMI